MGLRGSDRAVQALHGEDAFQNAARGQAFPMRQRSMQGSRACDRTDFIA